MISKGKKNSVGTYIDLFSGCGGLSLGLGNAGWKGLFAVEKDLMAFSTFKHNMVDEGSRYAHFDWPEWLPQEASTIQKILSKYPDQLCGLNGQVDLIAGGPPCQGFSLAGMRNSQDPRNKLSQQYIKMVEIIQPKYLLLENVRGFNAVFTNGSGKSKKKPYSEIVQEYLEGLGYEIFKDYVHCDEYGVPQSRTRFIMIGIRRDIASKDTNPFVELKRLRASFLKSKGLENKKVSVKEAICDLETLRRGARLVRHSGSEKSGFMKLDYKVPKNLTNYQKLMRRGLNGEAPTSMRLARHRQSTIEKFELIRSICRPGLVLNDEEREVIGTSKQAICVLDKNQPAKTLTTLPDDLLHYKEPRILTVRESARIQSFPDDFIFKGNYTTGGKKRKKECPRYTQVGNAVPPLLGEALGILAGKLMMHINAEKIDA